jgi:hypothetical protein
MHLAVGQPYRADDNGVAVLRLHLLRFNRYGVSYGNSVWSGRAHVQMVLPSGQGVKGVDALIMFRGT